jgi:hypothetical protein
MFWFFSMLVMGERLMKSQGPTPCQNDHKNVDVDMGLGLENLQYVTFKKPCCNRMGA